MKSAMFKVAAIDLSRQLGKSIPRARAWSSRNQFPFLVMMHKSTEDGDSVVAEERNWRLTNQHKLTCTLLALMSAPKATSIATELLLLVAQCTGIHP